MVDSVLREVLDEVFGPQEAQHVLGWSSEGRNLVFYADNGRIAGQDHKWVQDILTVNVEMLLRVGLDTNLDNTKSMVCMPGFIWGKWSEEAYK